MRRNVFVQNHADVARDDILGLMAALRRHLGFKTMPALEWIARRAGLMPRRTKTIVMRDVTHVVTDEQRRHLALSIADGWERVADLLEEQAEICRQKGDTIRQREQQQLSWIFGGTKWGVSTTSSNGSSAVGQRRAA